jgi:hypothetical protein
MEHISSWSDVNILDENINIKKITETLLEPSREAGLEGAAEKTKYVIMSHTKMEDKIMIY